MKDEIFAPCSEWARKLAAFHPDDLLPSEKEDLDAHVNSCSACAARLADYYMLRDLVRGSSIPGVPNDLPPRLLQLWESGEQGETLDGLTPPQSDPSVVKGQKPPMEGFGILQIHVQCFDKFFEVLSDEVENAELTVEDMASQVLLDLFGSVAVDEVTMPFSPKLHTGLRQISIRIQAQCHYQSFSLLPRTQEHMRLAVEEKMSSLLKELFGSVHINSVSIGSSPEQLCDGFSERMCH